jgi:hypothetical protein
MTHDELLIEINRRLEIALYNGDPQSIHALRAVVELHKPKNYIIKGFEVTESWCTGDSESLTPYPCPTVQAIEKELK